MKKQLLSIAAILTLASCTITGDHFSDQNGHLGEPANYKQFQSVLKQSKLQISDPNGKRSNKSSYAIDGDFSGIVNEYFYVDKKTEALVFKMKNDHLRNELRLQENFPVNSPNNFYTLSAEIEVIDPVESMKNTDIKQNEITLIQVHNKGIYDDGTGSIPHPLLRLVWKLDKDGIKGHFWAIIKNNAVICKGDDGKDNKDKPICEYNTAYKLFDLGKAPIGKLTAFDVTVGNNQLAIKVNGQLIVNHNINYWSELLSYFKAGVYNQYSNGMTEVHFYKLDYNEASTITEPVSSNEPSVNNKPVIINKPSNSIEAKIDKNEEEIDEKWDEWDDWD